VPLKNHKTHVVAEDHAAGRLALAVSSHRWRHVTGREGWWQRYVCICVTVRVSRQTVNAKRASRDVGCHARVAEGTQQEPHRWAGPVCGARGRRVNISRPSFLTQPSPLMRRRKPAAPVPGQLPTPTERPSPLDPGTRGRSQCLSRRLLASQYTYLESKATAGAPMQGRPCWDSYVSAKCTSVGQARGGGARAQRT